MTHQAVTTARLTLDAPVHQLLDRVDADPLAPLTLAIPAPGGFGKSVLLAELAHRYRAAGVPVLGLGEALAAEPDEKAALLVDDVHQLHLHQIGALTALAETGWPRIAIAYRPWPRPAGLAELADRLIRTGHSLPFGHWSRERTADYLADALPTRPPAAAIDFAHAQTGGVPRLLSYLTSALAEPAVAAEWAESREFRLPRATLAALRPDLDRLDGSLLRYLLAVEAGVGRHTELVGALLGVDTDGVADAMDAARATSLLGADGTLLPLVRRAMTVLIPAERRIAVRQRLAELQHERGGPVLDLASSLLGTGIGGAAAAAVFQAAAEEALPGQPALSAKLFAAAAAATGRPTDGLATGWARAAARSGDLDRALRLADQTIATDNTEDNATDRAQAAEIAAAALAHRGQLGRSAELYRWAGAGFPGAFAAIGLIGTGQLAAADKLPNAATDNAPPTLLAGAASLMAQGVRESVMGAGPVALSHLVRAATLLEPSGQTLLLPDSPAALAALIALHGGELGLAESVLARAVGAGLGGPLLATRHRLLQAWIAMARGRMPVARELLITCTRTAKSLEPRDWLFAVALEVGLARRNSDLAGLRRTWSQACEAVIRHPVDLFTLLPLAEFAVAAARLRDQARLRPHLEEATALLASLGNPPLWTTSLHWSGLHAAIIAEQPAVAMEHATAMARAANHGPYWSILAEAADCWLAVIAGRIDAGRVEAAARGLHNVGLCWDGARLAGQAAIRTSDRKAMVSLLNCARVLQGRPARPASAAPAITAPPGPAPMVADDQVLSEREREVAAQVVAGLTYKQVGDRLFISAKTVEHHVARMRQKLGATSRAELLDQLRRLTGAR